MPNCFYPVFGKPIEHNNIEILQIYSWQCQSLIL